jgi:hypothetical protein
MEQLIKRDIEYPANATEEHKAVIQASMDKPLKYYDISKLIDALTVLFLRAKSLSGQVAEANEVAEAAIDTISQWIISGKYKNLTAKQLEAAIEKGAMGEFGEYMGINAKTIHNWIKYYYTYQMKFKKIQAEYNERRKFENEQKKQSQHFKENEKKYFFNRWEQEYNSLERVENYRVYDPNNKFYEYLLERELIPFPNPRRKEYIAIATRITKEGLRDDITRASGAMRTTINDWLKNFDQALINKPVMRQRFQSLVMDLILTDYMRGHLELGSSFEEMVK